MKLVVRSLLVLLVLTVSAANHSSVLAQDVLEASLVNGLEVSATKGDRQFPYYIHASQKAYLVAFELSPQDGSITLVYPNELQPDDQVKPGYLNVLEAPRTDRLYTTTRSYPVSGLLNSDRYSSRGGLTYLYVVASEAPFLVSPLEGTPKAFRKRFAVNSFHIEGMVSHIKEQLLGEDGGGATSLIIL